MDYKELIAGLRDLHENYISEFCADDTMNCDDLCDGRCKDCIVLQAITAIETLLAEREAAVESMRGDCGKCVNRDVPLDGQPCFDCRHGVFALEPKADHWQWRGPTPP